MARPFETDKQSVDLASSGVRVSRVRRDPRPAVKQKIVDPAERDQWTVLVGVVAFALAFVIIIFGFSSTSFQSSGEHAIELTYSD